MRRVSGSKGSPRGSGAVSVGAGEIAQMKKLLRRLRELAVEQDVDAYLHHLASVGQWVAHDLRRTLYHHIQRLSLAEHDKTRTGDLITRVTSDIDAIQDFIGTALLGMLVNLLTLGGMIGVMLYINWRFTLISLSVVPVLFLVVYFTQADQEGVTRR